LCTWNESVTYATTVAECLGTHFLAATTLARDRRQRRVGYIRRQEAWDFGIPLPMPRDGATKRVNDFTGELLTRRDVEKAPRNEQVGGESASDFAWSSLRRFVGTVVEGSVHNSDDLQSWQRAM
jgi:hypothetical protein